MDARDRLTATVRWDQPYGGGDKGHPGWIGADRVRLSIVDAIPPCPTISLSGCAAATSDALKREVTAEREMGPHLIEMATAGLGRHLCFSARPERFELQALVSKLAVEAVRCCILSELARIDRRGLDALVDDPLCTPSLPTAMRSRALGWFQDACRPLTSEASSASG